MSNNQTEKYPVSEICSVKIEKCGSLGEERGGEDGRRGQAIKSTRSKIIKDFRRDKDTSHNTRGFVRDEGERRHVHHL